MKKALVGFPGYAVDTNGIIYCCRKIGRPYKEEARNITSSWRILKTKILDGYELVNLTVKSKQTSFRVHTLVLTTFIGACPQGMEACHKDGDKLNNRLDNLRWDTPKNNSQDKQLHGTMCKGESHGRHKLTELQVRDIINAHKYGKRVKQLAISYKVSESLVYMILRGDKWKHLSLNNV